MTYIFQVGSCVAVVWRLHLLEYIIVRFVFLLLSHLRTFRINSPPSGPLWGPRLMPCSWEERERERERERESKKRLGVTGPGGTRSAGALSGDNLWKTDYRVVYRLFIGKFDSHLASDWLRVSLNSSLLVTGVIVRTQEWHCAWLPEMAILWLYRSVMASWRLLIGSCTSLCHLIGQFPPLLWPVWQHDTCHTLSYLIMTIRATHEDKLRLWNFVWKIQSKGKEQVKESLLSLSRILAPTIC